MATRERSPNYPGHSLEAAIRFVEALYQKEKRSPVPLDSVAKALGSENLTGPSRSKIAAMRQFGLIESVGSGRIKVSDLALAIIHKPSTDQYMSAIEVAAVKPELFLDLRSEYGDASDETLRYHLIKDRSFSPDGANRVVKTFRETMQFATVRSPRSVGRQEAPITEDKLMGIPGESGRIGAPVERRRKDSESMATYASYNWPVDAGLEAQVMFVGRRPTESAIDTLINYLNIAKKIIVAEQQQQDEASKGEGRNGEVAE